MSADKVREYLREKGLETHITVHAETIDTVEHAAEQIGCSEAEIAKTLSFMVDDKPVIVAGDEFTSVALTLDELEASSNAEGWCDICKGWETA